LTNSCVSSIIQTMKVDGQNYRTIWLKDDDPGVVQVIDQRHLPHRFNIEDLTTVADTAVAIREMHVRGAGLIGATAGYGMYLAALAAAAGAKNTFLPAMEVAASTLKATRPTAVNLQWAVDRQLNAMRSVRGNDQWVSIAKTTATKIADQDAEFCRRIGEHGLSLSESLSKKKHDGTVNVLTHCNAGWLAFVDYGSATAPIYAAVDKGIDVHVWVDETRPRNQGARLTAWELGQQGVRHTVIADNVGGHLMQHGQVDLVITGTDRTTRCGDVANKIGTYLKALAAHDNGIPFYVALPSSSFDLTIRNGIHGIPIEQRDATEVKYICGQVDGQIHEVLLMPESSPAANYAFDVTPARLVSSLITERGICAATEEAILALFPEFASIEITEEESQDA